MNIFALSEDVNEIAMWLMDKHCVKMPLESSMMLSTAHRYLDGTPTKVLSKKGRNITRYVLNDDRENILYGVSHVNHPSTKWTYQSSENYKWHFNLLLAMFKEYTYRYGKVHKCESLVPYLKNLPKNINIGQFTPPTPAMPDAVKVAGDSLESYRNYYILNKKHLASWQGKVNSRPVPSWYAAI